MGKPGVALVGVGFWGKNLLRNLNSLGVLRAVFDTNKNTLDMYSNNDKYKDVYFGDDWEKCLGRKDILGVVIATPPNTHHKLCMKALQAGKHVFIEKPMTLDVKEAEEINNYAKSKDLIVMVGHIFLYSPEILKLKEIISNENFGDIYYIYTKRLNLGQIQGTADVIEDLIPHDISIFNYLLGRSCSSISANGTSHVLNGIVDVAFVNMKYDNIDVYCHLSWLDPNKCRETVVVGSKQMVVCDSINKQISIYNKNVDISAMEKNMSLEYVRHVLSYHYGDIVIPHIDVWEPLSEECKVFMDCIENNKTPISDGELGLNVVKVLTAATESLKRKGEWVTL